MVVSPEPYICPPITQPVFDDYVDLQTSDNAPALRAWVRETEKVCLANQELVKE